jgi:hypothetical protein
MEEEDRGRVWRLYGWFTALMACGSCVGAVTWAANMMLQVNGFKGFKGSGEILTNAQKYLLFANGLSWRAAFTVTYAIEFMCLSAAKLMVLDRMAVFAAPQGSRLQKLWALAGRVVMAAVVLGNAAGLAANAAAAVHYHKAAQAISTASAYHGDDAYNNTEGHKFYNLGLQELQRGGSIASVQLFSEVAVLLLIVVAFAVVGVLSARRVSARLVGVDAASPEAATGRAIRRRIIGTTAFVFLTFVLRAAFSTMYAVANQWRDIVLRKSTFCLDGTAYLCGSNCRNEYTLMLNWMGYTPEFQVLIVLVSSPLALLVALWGMTSNATLQLMQSSKREALLSLKPVKSALLK